MATNFGNRIIQDIDNHLHPVGVSVSAVKYVGAVSVVKIKMIGSNMATNFGNVNHYNKIITYTLSANN